MTCPEQRPGQPLYAHQCEVASWMGYPSVAAMNRHHDDVHAALCDWLGVTSHSLRCAAGEPHVAELAEMEETAVLALQRFCQHAGGRIP